MFQKLVSKISGVEMKVEKKPVVEVPFVQPPEEPWVVEQKFPDHYVVRGRKEEPETYTYPMRGFSRYTWAPLLDEINKVFVIVNKEKHLKYPDDPQYAYWQYFSCAVPAVTFTKYPGPYCVPRELMKYKPPDHVMFKYFFRHTNREVRIRQIFSHTELTEEEQKWVLELVDYCRWKKFPTRHLTYPHMMRIAYYEW